MYAAPGFRGGICVCIEDITIQQDVIPEIFNRESRGEGEKGGGRRSTS